MKVLCLVLAFAAAAHAVSLENDQEWIGFKTAYGKSYTNHQEELMRRNVFRKNQKLIQDTNEKKLGFTVAMNELGDLTEEEFSRTRLGQPKNLVGGKFQRPGAVFLFPENEDPANLPNEVDWRKHGYVTPIKDQGQCGSCWSFSATGSLEGQHFRKTGKLVSLSEQNLVDCSTLEGDNGCHGGLMNDAFTYVAINGGIMSEADYPYKHVKGNCSYNRNRAVAHAVSYVNIPPQNESALKMAVATVGPISVAIDASAPTFRFYKSGVYYSPTCSSFRLDHGVLAAGYGVLDGQDYWLVKNSWGTVFGDAGYIRMSRNRNNNCGIASDPSYPIV
uniref:Cysteine proteinase Cathepsin F n=1 Tax=Sycon ciliatum TaxID=27933 RepID=M1XYA5_9METZ|nr:Cysteine proteinase Cathepsin F [Sycon ciliatum]|eukprot:scpid85936/ scgid22169/ Digestive cysteine proteinase 2